MTSNEQEISSPTESLLRKAEEFHGHLGPFLVMGVRMGQICLEAFEREEHRNSLHVSLKVPFKVPYSCVVDGIQITTKCTVGNQKLKLKNAEEIEAKFEDSNSGRSIIVTPRPSILPMLKERVVGKNLSDEETRKLALNIASMPDKDLFIVKNG